MSSRELPPDPSLLLFSLDSILSSSVRLVYIIHYIYSSLHFDVSTRVSASDADQFAAAMIHGTFIAMK